jgi:lipopolysaccharide/colanic/teichoic acid biosynthesis glycosyltransferase
MDYGSKVKRSMRRLLDILFAILWLIITAPIMLLITILIKFDSPGPVFYLPLMIGRNGKIFSLFRFRTMSAATPGVNTQPRLTRPGRFIRNYSLDHLPTLINLLRGDLTIVGPRPIEIDIVDLQDPMWQQYFQVKPGLFNYAVLKLGKLWTSTRVSNPALNQELELEYRQKQSTALDLQLVTQFLRAFITSGGNIKARGKPDSEAETQLRGDANGQ